MKNIYIATLLTIFIGLISCKKQNTLQIDKSLFLNKWSVDSIFNYTSENGIPYRFLNNINSIEFKSDGKQYTTFQINGTQRMDTALYNITSPNTIDIFKIFNGQPVTISDKMIISLLTENKLTFRLNTPTLNSAIYKMYYLHR